MIRLPPSSTLTGPLCPYTTLFRSAGVDLHRRRNSPRAREGEGHMVVVRLGLRRSVGMEAVALVRAGARAARARRLRAAVAGPSHPDGPGECGALGGPHPLVTTDLRSHVLPPFLPPSTHRFTHPPQ